MILEEFINELSKLGININNDQINKLDKYYNLLIEWNNKINLTRITEKKDVYLKHFYDSLTLSKVINLNDSLSLCDVGSGAGFPGIVLKIIYPNLNITLIDSLNKRITFLNEVIKQLELTNIKCIHTRCELYAKENREVFDIVTSRAVANLKLLSELCIPLVKENGFFIPMKANIDEEIELSKDILIKLDAKIIKRETFKLPIEESIRNILLIKKYKKTNKIYPRRLDKIK